MSITATGKEKRVFTLSEARELLPLVKKITKLAATQVDALADRLERINPDDAEFESIRAEIDAHVKDWAESLQNLGCEVKGLWLVDFDNGQGFYCWSYPEEELDHYHDYEEGYAKRIRIC